MAGTLGSGTLGSGTLGEPLELFSSEEVSTLPRWTYILCKADGTKIGEIQNAGERNLTLALNKPSIAGFSIYVGNELLTNLLKEDTLLQIYRDKTLRFYGYIVSAEFATQDETGQATVKCNAVSPAWRLSRRLLGQSKGGTKFEGDKADNAKKMIDELNASAETGIKTQAVESKSTGSYVAGPYKAALACINDLARGFDGFDWYLAPLEGKEPKLGLFEAEATYGNESSAVLEYGWGQKNVKSITFSRDVSNLTNVAFHLPDDGLETGEVLSKSDATSITEHGRYEEIADASGLIDKTLREKWLEEFIYVKKNPRFVVSMALDIDDGTGRVPQLGADFFLGDTIQARAVVEENVTLFNGKVRIYQIKVEIDSNGMATTTPVLIDEEGELS